MRILRKKALIIQILSIICILTSTAKFNLLSCESISYNTEKVVNIAVLLSDLNNPYINEVKQSFENLENEKKGLVKFTIYDGKNSLSEQEATFDLISKGNYDLIVALLADTREDSVINFTVKAKAMSIPLILLNVEPEIAEKASKYYDRVVFLLFNSQKAGAIEGKIVADLWNNNKSEIDKNRDGILQYILVKGKTNAVIADQRAKGAILAINDFRIETDELQTIYSDWTKESTKNTIRNLILRYSNKVEAIISSNDAMAIGTIEAIQGYGYNTVDKSRYIPVVGVGGIKEAKELVDKGIMAGTVIQDTKELVDDVYAIGMNLINNVSPLNNTNLIKEGTEIMILENPKAYTKSEQK